VARGVSGLSVGLAAGSATAWLTELDSEHSRRRASLIATTANFIGAALGPLLSGALAQFLPFPLDLPFLVYLALLLALFVPVALVEETVRERQPLASVDWTPRIGIPARIRADFVAPAITVFGAMAVVGYYGALVPSILAENLHKTSHFVAGIVVALLCASVAGTIVMTRRLASGTAMLAGLVLTVPALGLMTSAQVSGSMPLLIAGTLLGGAAAALGYRGSLQVVNDIAPDDRRAEVLSLYFVAAFAGNGLPVIGVGIVGTLSTPLIAGYLFAGVIGVFSLLAIVLTALRRPSAR
jgi:MFS family permease